jgi:DNA-binding transcriptional LysR family regulator
MIKTFVFTDEMGASMDLAQLKVFQAVAIEGSVTRAAQRLHYVQSNVTVRLQQLEEELGVALFHREKRRLAITQEGVLLLDYTKRILALTEEATHAVQRREPSGPLRLGSMETTAAVRLPAWLARFHQLYPKVDLTLHTGPSDEVVQQVLNYQLDAGFAAAPVEHPELFTRVVCREKLVLVTKRDHPDINSAHDLTTRTLLVFRSGCNYRHRLEEWVKRRGVLSERLLEFGSFQAILGCVAAGMGTALLPETVVAAGLDLFAIRSQQIEPDIGEVDTLLVWRRDRSQHSALAAFIDSVLPQPESAAA